MKTKRLISIFLLLACMSLAQEPGYFGRRTLIEVQAGGALPVFQNLVAQDKGFVYKDGSLQRSYNLTDVNLRVSVSRISSENFGIGLEYQQRFYAFNPLYLGGINRQFRDANNQLISQEIQAQVAHIRVSERVIMLRYLIATDQNRIPAGFHHEFGIGYTMSALQSRNPQVAVDSSLGFAASDISDKFIDERVEELKGLRFQYGFRVNFPVSRQVLFSVGVRYNYSVLFDKKRFRNMEETPYWLSGRETWSRLNQRRQWGIMELGAGLIFCL